MQFSESYLALLREFEGFSAIPYLCTSGCCTIGYGTNLEAHRKFIPWEHIRTAGMRGQSLCNALKRLGMNWSRDDAESAMLEELSETEAALRKQCLAYRTLLEKNEICRSECLLDMAYNMGVASLLGFYSTLPMIERGEYTRAAENLKSSRWYRQVGRRSRAICQMIKTGHYLLPSQVK